MLSKEEEEAIKRLEKRIKDNENYTLTQVWLTDDVVATNIVLKLITKLQKENEELKNREKRTIIFIDAQIRCFDRKIRNILSMKKERGLFGRERREIKYLVGKKDECEKIKNKINKLGGNNE